MRFFSEDTKEIKAAPCMGIECNLVWEDIPYLPPFIKDLAQQFRDEKEEGVHQGFTINLLSEEGHPFGLWLYVHGHIEDGKITYFQLNLDRKPEDDPPSQWRKTSEALGGYPRGFRQITESLGDLKADCEANLRIFYPKSPFKVVRRPPPRDTGTLKLTGETLQFANPNGTRAEITLAAEDSAVLYTEQDIELALGVDCFEAASKLMTENVSELFKTR